MEKYNLEHEFNLFLDKNGYLQNALNEHEKKIVKWAYYYGVSKLITLINNIPDSEKKEFLEDANSNICDSLLKNLKELFLSEQKE